MTERVLFVTSEIYPYAKTGGLGDVAGALPLALKAAGTDIRLMLPGYKAVMAHLQQIELLHRFPSLFGQAARLLRGRLSNGLTAYVLDCPAFYARDGIYVDSRGQEWADNHLRFAALCRVAADLPHYDQYWRADVIHGNDWQTGLIPAYLHGRADRPRTALTIHNLAYQGRFDAALFPALDLPPAQFAIEGVEFYGAVSFLKAGLFYADKLTTVSPTYAEEIQTPQHGCGMDGLLRARARDLTGILNGIDHEVWNPRTDRHLHRNYDHQDLDAKAENKRALMTEMGLPFAGNPLFVVIGRLTPQKGFDIILEAAPVLLEEKASIIFMGRGDEEIGAGLQALEKAYPQQVRAIIGFDEALEHRLHGAADAVIMPSRFEPCGLVQLYGLRYGAVPVVHRTGGLADTVVDAGHNHFNPQATGLSFNGASAGTLLASLRRACGLFHHRNLWRRMQTNAMRQDFGWTSAAGHYRDIYKRARLA